MRLKTISLALCGFLLFSLATSGSLSAVTETDVPGEDLSDVPRYPDTVRTWYHTYDDYTSISYRGAVDVTAVKDFYKTEMPKHGWTLTYEYSYGNYVSLSFGKKGFSADISIYPYYEGVTSVYVYYRIQRPQQISIPENVPLGLLLEFKSTGRCRVKADYSGPNPFLLYYRVGVTPPPVPVRSTGFTAGSVLPEFGSTLTSTAKPVSWDINIELSSPSEGTLNITANGWVVLPLTAEQKQMVSLAVAGYKFAPEMFNQRALQEIQLQLRRQLRYTADLEVTALNTTKLDWDDAASKLTFGVTLTAKSSEFGAELRRELPMSISTSGAGSIPIPMKRPEDLEGLKLDILYKVVAKRVVAELQMKLVGFTSTIGFDFEFELPADEKGVVTRTENMVVLDFGKMKEYWPPYTAVPEVQAHENVRFVLRVPSGAEAENLPLGYTQTNTTYTWVGSSAANAILALVSGEAGTRISYYVGPATATITNIEGSVGKTIEIENGYIRSVEIKSERMFVANLEKDQPLRRLEVRLAEPVDIEVRVQRLPEKPAEVVEPPAERGIVHQYLEVETTAPGQVESADLEFLVPQLWIRANNIDVSTVRLLRYQAGGWAELETTKIGEDENNVYFSAKTTGFSIFAVTAQAQLPTVPAPPPLPLWVIAVLTVVLVVAILGVVWRYLSR